MSTKLVIAAALACAALASPALADDSNFNSLLAGSGRYVPQANLPEVNARNGWANAHFSSESRRDAFASARPERHFGERNAPIAYPASSAFDFQLQGRP